MHARWIDDSQEIPRFERAIVSEHENLASAETAAKDYAGILRPEMTKRELAIRDQVIVRGPGSVSLKVAPKWKRRTTDPRKQD